MPAKSRLFSPTCTRNMVGKPFIFLKLCMLLIQKTPLAETPSGPLVRIGPQELSFYSMDIFKTVYSAASGFVKDPRVYSQFVQNDHAALFSIT